MLCLCVCVGCVVWGCERLVVCVRGCACCVCVVCVCVWAVGRGSVWCLGVCSVCKPCVWGGCCVGGVQAVCVCGGGVHAVCVWCVGRGCAGRVVFVCV